MRYTTLIDVASLTALLSRTDLAIVDCRFDLADADAGARAYAAAHVPGAVYAHLDRDLSGAKTGTNGRHPLPAPERLIATLGGLGIDRSVQVVAYDQNSGMWAARLWWLLRWMGHDAVAVLDGGLDAWVAAGQPTVAGEERREARTFTGAPDDNMVVSADQVLAHLGSPDQILVDARAPERYRGDIEPIDPIAGHIPGAINRFFQSNLRDGLFQPAEELRAAFGALAGDQDARRIVCYCGSGVTACQDLLAIEHAGLRGARLYAGSWSEWVADSRRPVERG